MHQRPDSAPSDPTIEIHRMLALYPERINPDLPWWSARTLNRIVRIR